MQKSWNIFSSVTRVGVIQGGNWRCHPYSIHGKKEDLFSHHCLSVISSAVPPEKWRPFLPVIITFISLGCHPRRECHPASFLPVLPRFYTVLCKFSHNFFSFGCHPLEGVTRGGPPPVTPLYFFKNREMHDTISRSRSRFVKNISLTSAFRSTSNHWLRD